jgi:multidrug efflux pump subunit AcrA (membrane-fusion protein)
VALLHARRDANIALTQWKIWQQALKAVGEKTVVVPIHSPIEGDIAEVNVQPGASVDSGQVIARIVDFRRVLLRLDLPIASTSTKPASSVAVETLDSTVAWRAHLRGRAASLEPGLQKASWLYEIVPDEHGASPRWQPGLFVRAVLEDSTRPAVPAIAIPSSALLAHQGRNLVYIEKRLGRYERREVSLLGREGDTLIVNAEGWLPEERVVFSGAQVLLSEEFRNETDED